MVSSMPEEALLVGEATLDSGHVDTSELDHMNGEGEAVDSGGKDQTLRLERPPDGEISMTLVNAREDWLEG